MAKMGTHKESDCPTIIDHRGNMRVLARLPLNDDAKKKRAARMTYRQMLNQLGVEPIPQSEWREIDNSQVMGTRFILNQYQSGGCVGWSAGGAEMRSRYSRGLPFEVLSGAFVYSQINGGQDAGAIITDAMGELEQKGICLKSLFDYPHIYSSQVSQAAYADALLRKLAQGILITSFADMMDAVQRGFYPQGPIQVGSNFENFTSEGVAGFSNGYGNHSIHVDGCKKLKNGQWALDMPNSWGLWGPFGNGRCFLTQQHIDGCASDNDAYVHVTPAENPSGGNSPDPIT